MKNIDTTENDHSIFSKSWQLGLLIIVGFSVVGELLMMVGEYVYVRVGIDRNILLIILWSAPAIAAFIATYYSARYKVLSGLSFIIIFPVIGTISHFINGELGGVVDFTGVSGAFVIFKIYLSIGSILVIVGTFIGLALSKKG